MREGPRETDKMEEIEMVGRCGNDSVSRSPEPDLLKSLVSHLFTS